jgi:hypothetical protein
MAEQAHSGIAMPQLWAAHRDIDEMHCTAPRHHARPHDATQCPANACHCHTVPPMNGTMMRCGFSPWADAVRTGSAFVAVMRLWVAACAS